MGARIVKFDFSPKENEEMDIIVKIPEDKRSVIHGIVKNWKNDVVKDAVVKLFEVKEKSNTCELKPLTFAFTDDFGQFLFGPLYPGKKYAIKVWFSEVNHREFELVPDSDCSDFCLGLKNQNESSIKNTGEEEY